MSTSDVQLILRRLDRMEKNMGEVFDRVRSVELWKARAEGALWAAGRLPVAVACLAGLASIVAIVVTLTK